MQIEVNKISNIHYHLIEMGIEIFHQRLTDTRTEGSTWISRVVIRSFPAQFGNQTAQIGAPPIAVTAGYPSQFAAPSLNQFIPANQRICWILSCCTANSRECPRLIEVNGTGGCSTRKSSWLYVFVFFPIGNNPFQKHLVGDG